MMKKSLEWQNLLMAKKQKTALEETQELAQEMVDKAVEETGITFDDEDKPESNKTETKPDVEDEKKPEETPKEEPKEEPKKPEETEIDEDEFTEKVSKSVADRLAKQITGQDEKKKDDVDQELVSPWTKEGRNPKDYDEIADWAMQKKEVLDKRRAVEEQKATEEQNQQKAQQEEAQRAADEERAKSFNQVIDDELDELYTNNKLPRVKDKDDANDPGVVARKALFQTMLDVNMKRKAEGKPAIMSVSRIFHTYYTPPTQQRPGADAPISMGQGAPEETDPDDYSYTDVKKVQKGWGIWRRQIDSI